METGAKQFDYGYRHRGLFDIAIVAGSDAVVGVFLDSQSGISYGLNPEKWICPAPRTDSEDEDNKQIALVRPGSPYVMNVLLDAITRPGPVTVTYLLERGCDPNLNGLPRACEPSLQLAVKACD